MFNNIKNEVISKTAKIAQKFIIKTVYGLLKLNGYFLLQEDKQTEKRILNVKEVKYQQDFDSFKNELRNILLNTNQRWDGSPDQRYFNELEEKKKEIIQNFKNGKGSFHKSSKTLDLSKATKYPINASLIKNQR